MAQLIRGITFGKSEQLDHATDDSLLVATTKAAQSSGIVEADLYHVPRTVLKDDTKLLRSGDILISTANSLNLLGRTTHVLNVERPMSFGAFMSLIRPNERILDGYLIHCLRTAYAADFFVRNANTTTNISNLNLSALAVFQIPLPPLEVQKEIVAEIEGYQKVINGARAVLDHYRPHIPIHPDWPMEVFGEVTSTTTPPAKIQAGDFSNVGRYPVIDQSQNAIAGRTDDESTLVDGTSGLVIFGDHTCAVKFVNERFAQGADGIKIIQAGERLEPKFIYFYLLSQPIEQDGYKRHFGKLKESRIAVPPLATQQAIVAEIEAEQALVAANRELITRFSAKIQATLARIWGEASEGEE